MITIYLKTDPFNQIFEFSDFSVYFHFRCSYVDVYLDPAHQYKGGKCLLIMLIYTSYYTPYLILSCIITLLNFIIT